jgi:glycosyltransferase involved in cell wall biosynthesis
MVRQRARGLDRERGHSPLLVGMASPSNSELGPPVEVSVVIPFRNAAPYLRDQLEALASQEFEGKWEVVLVDNGSRDNSREIAESFSDRLNLRIVDAGDKPGAAYATNVGVRHASGRKLIFVDADDEVAPGYIAAMAGGLDRYDFITSNFDHRTLNPMWTLRAQGAFSRDPEDPLDDHFGILPSAGASVGLSRAIFEAVGGFPEEFGRMYDIAFSWEVQSAGTPLHHVSDAVYRVRFRSTLSALFRQGLAGSSYAPLLYKRYRHLGMQRRTLTAVLRSWARLGLGFLKARNKADVASLMVQLGRELGRLRGSFRHGVFFP